MDSDEFYLKDEFKFLKRTMENPAFDGSACQLVTYWKTSEYILNPPETYYVRLIFKLTDRLFENCDFPVLVDPTRRMKSQAVRLFTRQEIEMHHLTAVRRDYRRKLESSSAINNFRPHIERIVAHWTDWHYPEPALMPGNPCQEYNILKVKDQFNVNYQTT